MMQNLGKTLYAALLIALIFSTGGIPYAQQYYFDNYSVQEGISSEVFTILKDRQGFIWLGTPDGLSRFNGFDFQHFTHDDHGLSSGSVKTLIEDSDGNLWAGHYGGDITKYDGRKFHSISTPASENNSDIWSIIQDVNGTLWFATLGTGVLHLTNPRDDIDNLEFITYQGGKIGDQVGNISLVNDTLYFLTLFGIRTFDNETRTFVPHDIEGINYAHKYAMIGDQNGNHWYGTMNDGLLKYNPDNQKLKAFDIQDGLVTNAIWSIMEDSKGRIWTINMTANYDKGGITRIAPDQIKGYDNTNGLPANMLHCLEEDREGNILIGTKRNGFYIFKGEQFITIPKQDLANRIQGLADPQVFDILQDNNGAFWFATDNGITQYYPENPREQRFSFITPATHGIHKSIRFLDIDSRNNIWIGTSGGGVYRYVAKNKDLQISDILTSLKYNRDNIVTALEIDNQDNVWVGTFDGLAYYNPSKKRDIRISQLHGLPGNNISALYFDNNNRLWVGCQKEGIAVSYNLPDSFKTVNYLQDATINCFLQDNNQQMWIGTNQGLYVADNDTIVQRFTVNDGLLANRINLLNIDNEGCIYVGTNFGLSKYIPEKNIFVTYTEKNGFTGRETKQNATFADNQGNLWFGTVNGAIKYNPEFSPDDFPTPLIYLTQIDVNQVPFNMYDGIKLKHTQDNLIFHYTAINLTNPDAVRFQVKLEGLNENWQQPTTEQTAKYQALSPGKYTFKVKAKNHYGIWNDEAESMSFYIKPPFYQTWWFILICIVVGGSAIYAYIKIRERNLVREKKILEEKVEERTLELSDANAELAMKNKDITDSIHYARRIQFAILPPEIPFENTFVLFKPKDIVSGDFYWINTRNNIDFIAAVDCTGHGVPGAFVSFIGYTALNKIILEKGITEPAKILDHLNEEVILALNQKGDSNQVKDGMDMSLVAYHQNNGHIEFAGAYNGIYIVRDNELLEYKGNRFAIGRSVFDRNPDFTNHSIEIKPGDVVYQFSDGYADQFGGPENKKFRAKPFKRLLVDIHQKPMTEQQQILDETIENWKGDTEQIDDILVIGRKF